MSITNAIKNGLLTSRTVAVGKDNVPSEYSERQHRYYDYETGDFVHEYAKYAPDFVEALVQGLQRNNPKAWTKVHIRMAEVVRPSAAISRNFDDYKHIIIAEKGYEYIPLGSKIVTMGSTWLVVNPQNISGSSGQSIIHRCNALWNHFDYYGNVISEPICVENAKAAASDNDTQRDVNITKGYFNITCQHNEWTEQLGQNSRIIFGKAVFQITGYSDYSLEFTESPDSIRLLAFVARFTEINPDTDDMENKVADGKNFSWELMLEAPAVLPITTPAMIYPITVTSVKNGEVVESTAENPISYIYQSTDEAIATVDESGNITPVAEGECDIIVRLEQNESKQQTAHIAVTQAGTEIQFISSIPYMLRYGDVHTFSAEYYVNGVAQDGADITWTLSNASKGSYSYNANGGECEVTCWGYSAEPLMITAECNGKSINTYIVLEGI